MEVNQVGEGSREASYEARSQDSVGTGPGVSDKCSPLSWDPEGTSVPRPDPSPTSFSLCPEPMPGLGRCSGRPPSRAWAFIPSQVVDLQTICFHNFQSISGPSETPSSVYSEGSPTQSSAEAETGSEGPDRAGVQLQHRHPLGWWLKAHWALASAPLFRDPSYEMLLSHPQSPQTHFTEGRRPVSNRRRPRSQDSRNLLVPRRVFLMAPPVAWASPRSVGVSPAMKETTGVLACGEGGSIEGGLSL